MMPASSSPNASRSRVRSRIALSGKDACSGKAFDHLRNHENHLVPFALHGINSLADRRDAKIGARR
jgi:hypothetical protein